MPVGSLNDGVDVVVPCRPTYLLIVRVLTAMVAAEAGFRLREVDDLRLATTEAFELLLQAGGDARIAVRYTMADGWLTVRLGPEHGSLTTEPDELSLSILHAVVDDFAIASSGVVLTKRLEP